MSTPNATGWDTLGSLRGPPGQPATRVSGFGPLRGSVQPRRFGLDANYSASPNVCKLSDGRIAMIWREGSAHASRDGKIMWSFSSDEGRTWTTPTVWMPYPGGGIDPRGTAITASSDGHTVWVCYFYGSDANAAMGVYFKKSTDNGATWGPEIRVDPASPYAATDNQGVIEVGNTLLLPWYGKQTSGEAYESIWLAKSTDGGQTWTSTRMVNGPATSRNYHEPVLIKCGNDNTLVMTFRWNTAESVGMMRSTNGGTTWTTPTMVIPNATAKPTLAYSSSTGALTCIYRGIGGSYGVALYRTSYDLGSTWSGETVLGFQTGSGWTVYAGAVEISPGFTLVPLGVEQANGTQCRILLYYLTDGAAITPIGSMGYDRVTRALLRADEVLALDDFDRPNTTSGLGDCLTGQPWQVMGSGMRIIDSQARGQLTTGVSAQAWVETKIPSATVEADLLWTANSNVGLILRYKDINNYFYYVAETNGTAVRLYVRNAGTFYKLTEATSVPTISGNWHRIKANVRGTKFLGFIDDQLVTAYTIGTVDQNLLGAETKYGFQLAEGAAPGHWCRRFEVQI